MSNTTTQKEVRNIIDTYIKSKGLKMCKKIQEGSYGFFHTQPPTYDRRTAWSYDEARRLTDEGFALESDNQDIGVFLLNAFFHLEDN